MLRGYVLNRDNRCRGCAGLRDLANPAEPVTWRTPMVGECGDLCGVIGQGSIENGKWKLPEADAPNAAGMNCFPSPRPFNDQIHDVFKLLDQRCAESWSPFLEEADGL